MTIFLYVSYLPVFILCHMSAPLKKYILFFPFFFFIVVFDPRASRHLKQHFLKTVYSPSTGKYLTLFLFVLKLFNYLFSSPTRSFNFAQRHTINFFFTSLICKWFFCQNLAFVIWPSITHRSVRFYLAIFCHDNKFSFPNHPQSLIYTLNNVLWLWFLH